MSDPNAPQQPADPSQPPAGQPVGQQPPAGQQPPTYGQQPPAYGQQPPAYGQQPPTYEQQPAPGQPYAAQPQYAAPQPAGPLTAEQDKSYAAWSHFGGALSFLALFTGWLAILAIIPALVFYLAFGKRGERVRQESKEALNFQITMVGAMIIWAIVALILNVALFVPLVLGGGWFILGLILALVGWALVIIDVVFSLVAGVRVNAGGSYRYPFAVRFIK